MYIKNIGRTERFLRLVIALILFIAGYYYTTPYYGFVVYLFGIIFVITAVLGWCPLFNLFGYSSKGKGIDKITKRDIERAVKENSVNFEAKVATKKKAPVKKNVVAEKKSVKVVEKKAPAKKAAAKKVPVKKAAPIEAPAKKASPKKTTSKKK